MKKEKMKQICNYFMKGLLLCALVFGFWFMADLSLIHISEPTRP